MGNSGGRSSSHRTGRGAVARSTERQRSYVDPPPTASWDRLEERGLHDDLGPSTLERIWVWSIIVIFCLAAWSVSIVGAIWLAKVLGLL